MSTNTGQAGGNNILYFIVGALVVAVGVLGYLYYDAQQNQADITVNLPSVDAD
ncbi:MAG: hypothetical protein LPL00_03950 [Alphaproteobacteria bacterium]|nr:hypothetical protein [Alphaproteobacteria bacterium]MDX5368645.1 hypothetical protein [Alphaproteobacteria bacterium]MDX5463390.1 hypothetical protein [Alphaproteobacteria bacterium]